ncbi:DoxX family protein [Gordonia sp. X0973]|uniref:DoxX family protein n=1 Tax=Gordonia sp. X0973 TaxID=2742602 RepID=UPI000F53E4A0|nr:DoxX family protein [Gordonia sp. X0973]QKT06085.1 DoxX family protein [Gordonia sp. X0973]
MSKMRSVTSFLLRVTVGAVFIAHGWEKLAIKGIDKTTILFGDGPGGQHGFHIPFPGVAAHIAAWTELIGGIALILGVLLPFVGVLLAATMVGAGYYGHHGSGFWIQQNGWEYNLVLAVAVLAVGFAVPGALSVDHYRRNRGASARHSLGDAG